MENQPITQAQLNLIKKIVNAHLTKEELQAVSTKAKDILQRRSVTSFSTK